MSADFGQRLQQTISANRSVLCVGIDPHPSMMPALFGGTEQHIGDADSLQHLKRFCSALIQASAGRVAAIKPQVAFFEAYGPKVLRFAGIICTGAQRRIAGHYGCQKGGYWLNRKSLCLCMAWRWFCLSG